MSAALHISIPQTSVVNNGGDKPYTVYHVVLQLPLRMQETRKRYTDFAKLNAELVSQAGAPPTEPLPPKNWLRRTVDNAGLTESRRAGLEKYIQAIMNSNDNRWRSSAAWRAFLDLPRGSSTMDQRGNLQPTNTRHTHDPLSSSEWLDLHRDLKSKIGTIRQQLKQREAANTPQQQHSLSADAKAKLVRAATMTDQLQQALTTLGDQGAAGSGKLGEGEIRRRRDMVVSARKEVQALEGVLKTVATRRLQADVSAPPEKESLLNDSSSAKPRGRVLGGPVQETGRTRELGNDGVLQLQKQIMKDQDDDVLLLGSAINKLKDMGIMMNEEVTIQNEMLRMLEDDTERVQGKLDVGRKRIQKIK